jgi:hypothetical protein
MKRKKEGNRARAALPLGGFSMRLARAAGKLGRTRPVWSGQSNLFFLFFSFLFFFCFFSFLDLGL